MSATSHDTFCDKTKGGSKTLQEGVAGTLGCRINGECSQNVAILELEPNLEILAMP